MTDLTIAGVAALGGLFLGLLAVSTYSLGPGLAIGPVPFWAPCAILAPALLASAATLLARGAGRLRRPEA